MLFSLRGAGRLAMTLLICLGLALTSHCGGGGGNPVTVTPSTPTSLNYPHAALVTAVGQALIPDTPKVVGSVGTFSIAPALPGGLGLDPATGTISGTPTVSSALTSYTVTMTAGGVSAITTVQITVLPAGSVTYQTLACGLQIQEHSEWCWAATGASVLAYLGAPQSQCEIANYVRNIGYACGNTTFNWSDSIANRPIEALYGTAPSVTDFMAHFGKPCTGRSSALSFAEIQTEIGASRPFVVNWAWTGGGGHILVGMGWDTRNGGQEVNLMDPWPGEGFKLVDYDWVNSGSDPLEGNTTHTWRWSLTLNH